MNALSGKNFYSFCQILVPPPLLKTTGNLDSENKLLSRMNSRSLNKVSSKLGVYEFLVFDQIPSCNSMLFSLVSLDGLSMVKSIYLSNQKQRVKVSS
jgi:hypothetical protein